MQLGLTIAILFFTFKVVKCIGKNFGEENTQIHFPRRRRRLQHQGKYLGTYKNRVKTYRNIFDILALVSCKERCPRVVKEIGNIFTRVYTKIG